MEQEKRLVTNSARQTRAFFRRLAETLNPGDVIGLVGELGAGKTTGIQAVLAHLGVEGGESPTFIMVRPYQLPQPVRGIEQITHVDAYRFDHPRDAETAGLNDYLADKKAVIFVEWADRVRDVLPERTRWITLRHMGEDRREISWDGS